MKWLVACLLCWPLLASADTYNLSLGQRPPCSTNWSVSGTVYTCTFNGRVTLGSGDQLIADSAVTVRANNGFELNNSSVGTAQNTVSLQSDYGSVLARNSTLYGSVAASSGNFEFTDTSVVGALTTGGNIVISGGSVNGNVQSQSNTVRITGATIQGSITANRGTITLTDARVAGAIQTECCTVTATNSHLSSNILARSGMTFTGGSITGDLTMLASNPLTMTGVSYLAGEASGASTATITNSQVGSAGQTINITTTTGAITFSNSIAYGIYQAPGNSTVNVQNNSQIYGQCLPNSNPANACAPLPPPQPAMPTWCEDIWPAATTANALFPLAADRYIPNVADAPLGTSIAPGEYLRRGTFTLGSARTVPSPSALVVIDGNFTLDANFNATGNPANLLLYVTGELTIEAGVSVRGYLLANTVRFANRGLFQANAVVQGAVSAFSGITYGILHRPTVSYQAPSAVLQGGKFCLSAPRQELYLTLNDGPWQSGLGNVQDSGVNNLPVAAVNNPVFSRELPALAANNAGLGTCGYAEFSAGQSQYFEVPDSPFIKTSGSFTAGLWVYPQSRASLMTLFSKDENFELHINNSGHVNWWWQNSAGTVRQFNSTQQVPLNQWSYIAIRYTPGRQTIFVNGAKTEQNFNEALRLNTRPLQLGSDQNTAGRFFDGRLDEFSFYRGRLSDADIAALAQQRSGSCPSVVLSCVNDTFESSNGFGQLWNVLNQSGNFTPQLNSGTLRLTQSTNQATVASLRRVFPAANNFLQIEFDFHAYGGNVFGGSQGGDGIAVVLSDAETPLRAGAFGGSLGYAQKGASSDCPNCPGFAAGWLGVGLDVFGNFSIASEGRVGGAAANTNISQTSNRVVVRGSAGSNYAFITQSNQLTPGFSIAGNTRGPGHRYRITLNSRQSGTALLTVERNTGSGYVTVIPERNVLNDLQGSQGNVPANLRLSFTGSTGSAFNIHELDNVQVCAERSSGGLVLDHIRLLHPATQVSCVDASLELTACLNNECSATLSEPGSVRLQSSGGSFNGSQVTQIAGSNATINFAQGQARANLRWPQTGTAQIDWLESNPQLLGNDPFRCFADGLRSDCTISFTEAGLTFIRPVPDNTTYAGLDYSGQLSSQCGVRVSGTKSVQLGVQCVNPQACISGQQFTVNGVSIAANPAGQTAGRTAIPLTFNAQGVADFNFRYTDVGELRLYANLVLPAEPDAPALTLTAESSPFVVKPHTIQFVEAAQLPYRANSNPGTRQSGVGFWSAGKPFRVLAQAQNAQGNITPNFGNELTRQRLALALHELVYPAAGVAEPSLLEFGEFQPATVAGRQQSDTVVWHEAGTIRLQAKLANQDYLGAGDAFATSVSSDVGRFYPDRFRLQHALTQNSCNSFTYMGQPAISLSYLLHAEGYTGRVLQNYDTSLYLGTAQFSVVASNTEVANPALSLGGRLSVNQSSWVQGRYQVSQTDAGFSRQASQQPDGPFNALQLGLQLVSEIDNRPLIDLNFNAASSGNCGANCTAVSLGEPLNLRYGRLLLENAFGSELEPLPLKLVAEYWNGQMFVTNTADNCTVISPANLQKTDGELTPGIAGDGGPLLKGVSSPVSLFLQAPGQTGALKYQYLSPVWLRFNWDNSNDYSQHARNEVLFGRYRGNSRLIFWREQ